jgi:cytochrome oxidase assembly protein ShyY1
MRRSLIRPRWFVLLAITLLVSVTCIRLGIWQWHRLQERRAYNEAVVAGLSRAPTPLSQLVPASGTRDEAAIEYRRVVATGTYDVSREFVLYGRTLDELPGNHVLTPLLMPDGRAVLVDRGWVPFSTSAPPVAEATPPSGRVTVVGVLEPSDPPGKVGPDAAHITTTTTVDIPALSGQLPYPTLPMFVWLQSQSPGQSAGIPTPAPLPPLSEGPHEGYMLQWFAFAAIFLGGFVVLVSRDARALPGADAERDGRAHAGA